MAEGKEVKEVCNLLQKAIDTISGKEPDPKNKRDADRQSSSCSGELERLFPHIYKKKRPSESAVAVSTTNTTSTTVRPVCGIVSRRRRNPRSNKVIKSKMISRKFLCLADKEATGIPTQALKRELLQSGLGEKKIMLPQGGTCVELHECLLNAFPQLQSCGGYELMYAEPGRRELLLLPMGPKGNSVEYICQFIGQGKVYVRPIQSSIDMAEIDNSGDMDADDVLLPEELCNTCLNLIPLVDLRQHAKDCAKKPEQAEQPNDDPIDVQCSICLEPIVSIAESAFPSNCSDMFHSVCIEQWFATGNGSSKCPTCYKQFDHITEGHKVETTLPLPSSSNLCDNRHTSLQQGNLKLAQDLHYLSDDSHFLSTNYDFDPDPVGVMSALPRKCHDYGYVNHQYGNIITLNISDDSDDDCVLQDEVTQNSAIPFIEKLSSLCNDKCREDEEDSYIRLKVRRSSVWQDVKLKLGRIKTSLKNGFVKVNFVAESAVDDGGPKRELFNLINQEVLSSSLFLGQEGRAFAQNLPALARKEYYTYGLCCGLGILNGAQGPQAFSSPIVQYILNENLDMVTCPVSCIPDTIVKANLQAIECLTDADTYSSSISRSAACRSTGYKSPDVTLENKDTFLNMVATHHTVTRSLAEIHQFIDGLKVFGVLDLLREYPVEAADIFEFKNHRLTAEKIDNLFQSHVSLKGSNRHKKEMAILFNWRQFLEDVEQGDIVSTTFDLQEQNIKINVSAVLAFVTGSPSIPPLGFSPKPRIVFDYEELPKKLHVHTCANEIHFPVAEHLLSYESFKDEFLFCMLNSPGFGMV